MTRSRQGAPLSYVIRCPHERVIRIVPVEMTTVAEINDEIDTDNLTCCPWENGCPSGKWTASIEYARWKKSYEE